MLTFFYNMISCEFIYLDKIKANFKFLLSDKNIWGPFSYNFFKLFTLHNYNEQRLSNILQQKALSSGTIQNDLLSYIAISFKTIIVSAYTGNNSYFIRNNFSAIDSFTLKQYIKDKICTFKYFSHLCFYFFVKNMKSIFEITCLCRRQFLQICIQFHLK